MSKYSSYFHRPVKNKGERGNTPRVVVFKKIPQQLLA